MGPSVDRTGRCDLGNQRVLEWKAEVYHGPAVAIPRPAGRSPETGGRVPAADAGRAAPGAVGHGRNRAGDPARIPAPRRDRAGDAGTGRGVAAGPPGGVPAPWLLNRLSRATCWTGP